MKHLRSGGSDARSVMAQCGSDSGDSSDPEAELIREAEEVGAYTTPHMNAPQLRLSWMDDQDPEGGDFMGFGKYATWTYQQVKDVDDAYCAWAMEACDTTSSLGFRRFVSWLNSATAAPAVVEAVLPRPSMSSPAACPGSAERYLDEKRLPAWPVRLKFFVTTASVSSIKAAGGKALHTGVTAFGDSTCAAADKAASRGAGREPQRYCSIYSRDAPQTTRERLRRGLRVQRPRHALPL